MAMPKAAMDHNQCPVFRQHDIWFPGNILYVKTETETEGVQPLSEK